MCFAPQRRALFRRLNFQEWSSMVCFVHAPNASLEPLPNCSQSEAARPISLPVSVNAQSDPVSHVSRSCGSFRSSAVPQVPGTACPGSEEAVVRGAEPSSHPLWGGQEGAEVRGCGGDRSQLLQVVSEEVGCQPKERAPDVQSLSGPVDRAPGAGTREITGRKCINRANATQSVPQGQGQAHDHRWQVLSDGAHQPRDRGRESEWWDNSLAPLRASGSPRMPSAWTRLNSWAKWSASSNCWASNRLGLQVSDEPCTDIPDWSMHSGV